jgi:cation:H+ antiporter
MLLYLAAIAAGVVVLARAADAFVSGAAALSLRWGLPAVVVGAVVIGFGTSAPELLVSGIAAAEGGPDIAVGNIIGSNIANLTLVLGIAALVGAGVAVDAGTIRREVPLGIGATVLFGWFVHDGLTRLEGLILLAVLVGVLTFILLAGRRRPDSFMTEAAESAPERGEAAHRPFWQAGLGLVGVVLGAQALVFGAIGVADDLGLSGGFVGMTIVAIGTSLPEIVTSTQAASQGRTELLVGNLLGSNMFNSLAVGGTVALVAPGPEGAQNLAVVGVGAMIGTSLLALLFLTTKRMVSRTEAAFLVATYVLILPFLT